MYLTLPIPTSRSSSKVTLHQCLDAFVKEEVMEKSDAWCVFPSVGLIPTPHYLSIFFPFSTHLPKKDIFWRARDIDVLIDMGPFFDDVRSRSLLSRIGIALAAKR